ncbi:MAG: radical SAM protein [Oscillospiraceae bacterium]|nr:radical SAM protein [Oscillospiraceae bacterium]
MQWSRYSTLFESKRNGWLLFNTISRSLMVVKPEQLDTIRGIMADPEGYDYSHAVKLYMQLRAMGFLVEDGKDDEFYNIHKMRTLAFLYGNRSLMLTFALSMACNFDCSYCYESSHVGHVMTQETEDKVMRFIRKFRADKLYITWYGGEPLLAFDRILSMNRRLQDMGKNYEAAMITNGYLLTRDKADKLNDLRVNYLQITLDGSRETHNARRYLKGGGATYDKILENIDGVMASDFRGTVYVRVNVDGRNDEEFAEVYKMIRDKYPKDFGSRITVYPGFVKGDAHPDRGCFFDPVQQGEFISRMVEKYDIAPYSPFPQRRMQGCILTRRNAYVVGPDGEMYKCWDDVGMPEKIVGTVDSFKDWNMGLIAEGMTACSYLDSPECKACFYFPICDGGCHRIRQNNLHTDHPQSSCSWFRGNLENLLELHYESRKKQAAAQRQQAGGDKA